MAERVLFQESQIQEYVQQWVRTIQAEESLSDGDYVLVGVRTHGVTLARRIQAKLQENVAVDLPLGILDITLYRDDLGSNRLVPLVQGTDIDFDIKGKKILLVDDVLYTGRTIRAAMNALSDYGRPCFIKLAVLIDRGGRELPIEAQYTGVHVDIEDHEMVKLRLAEEDGQDEAIVCDRKSVL